jgi:hypothetical protein
MFSCFDCIGRCDVEMARLLQFESSFAAQVAVVTDYKWSDWRT